MLLRGWILGGLSVLLMGCLLGAGGGKFLFAGYWELVVTSAIACWTSGRDN